MIWSTLFLRIVIILAFFPGIFYMIYDKIIAGRKGTTDKFVLALITSALLSTVFVWNTPAVIVIILCLFIPILQVMLEMHGISPVVKAYREKKFLLQTLILIPFLEEYIFRYVMYEALTLYDVPIPFYIIFSTLLFTFLHYYRLKADSFYKTALGAMLAGLFAYTGNLFAVILIHIIFNVFVYLIKYTKNYRGFQS